MSIRYVKESGQLILETANTGYQIKIDEQGYVQHLYYGPRLGQDDMSYAFRIYDRGFSGNPYEMRDNRAYSLDSMPQEYTSFGVGDFRVNSIAASCSDGSRCAEFRYVSHEIRKGKYRIPGLPSVYDNGDTVDTLVITMTDKAANIMVRLYYGVFEELDIMTRTAGYGSGRLLRCALSCRSAPGT